MQRKQWITMVLLGLVAALPWRAALALDSTSSGADGDLVVSAGVVTTIDLPANGVLQYNSINIPATATVKFKRNASNTPVYLLVKNNATIAGAIDLSGDAGVDLNATLRDGLAGQGGPGGFDGGPGGKASPEAVIGAGGYGPGAGKPGDYSYNGCCGTFSWGGGGGASVIGNGGGSQTAAGGVKYGSSILDTVLGGSGGGGGAGLSVPGAGGGGGGGALFLVVGGTLSMPSGGAIRANGGRGGYAPNTGAGGAGAGGAIRIAATTFSGVPTLSALGAGGGVSSNNSYRNGGGGADGRIRIEAENSTAAGGSITPSNMSCINAACKPVALPVLPNNALASTLPSVRFSAVDGVAIASDQVLTGVGDIALSGSRADPVNVTITLTTANVPLNKNPVATITVRPDRGAVTSYTVSAWTGTDASATGVATTVKLPLGRNVVSASLGFTN